MKDILIKEAIELIKGLTMDIAYSDGGVEDFESIISINKAFEVITTEVEIIEADAERQRKIASKLRKQFGSSFSSECDAAGIE